MRCYPKRLVEECGFVSVSQFVDKAGRQNIVRRKGKREQVLPLYAALGGVPNEV